MKSLLLPILILFFLFCPVCAQDNNVYISEVKRVIDGDVLLLVNGERVRLIGIDAPEMDTEQGEKAFEFTKKLVEGKRVKLEFDVQEKDEYGRLLAYVFNIQFNENIFINAMIIKAGYATPMTIAPNIRHTNLFKRLYRVAREKKKGLWKVHFVYTQELSKELQEAGYTKDNITNYYKDGDREYFIRKESGTGRDMIATVVDGEIIDFNPFPDNRSSIYEYGDDIPDTCFFPADKAWWDGYEVTNKNWHQLTDFQKTMFIIEATDEIERQEGVVIGEYEGWRMIITLNEFVVLKDKKMPEEELPMIKLLFDTFKEGEYIKKKEILNIP